MFYLPFIFQRQNLETGSSDRGQENSGAKKRKLETDARGDNGENSTENSSRRISNIPQICGGLSVERISSSQPLRCRDLTGYHDNLGVNAVEFSDDGFLFASGGDDNRVLLWSTSKAIVEEWTPNPTAMETMHDFAIWCLAMSPDN